MKNKLLSVIVPVYNVEKFLRRCIDSILNQDYENIEIILVDDGSTDSSGEICEEYENKYDSVTLIRQENKGLSGARNTGLAVASGEYIMFIDSDDALVDNTLGTLIEQIQQNNLDIIKGDVCRVRINELYQVNKFCSDNGVLSVYEGEDVLRCCFQQGDLAGVWGRIYRREIVEGIKYPEGRYFEDTAVMYQYMVRAKRIGYTTMVIYLYTYNPNSITQTSFSPVRRWDYVISCEEVYQYVKINYPKYAKKIKADLIEAYLSYLTAVYGTGDNKITITARDVRQEIIKLRDQECYKYLKVKYKLYLWCCGRMNFLHYVAGKLSYWSKRIY